jgi:cell division protein FtsN
MPEFDGSKRKRLVKYFTVGLIAAALVITWVVVSSQIQPERPLPQPASSTPAIIEPPPPLPQPTETAATSAVIDPTKPTTTSSEKPAVKSPPKGKPGASQRPRNKPKSDDLVIEIPDVPPE